MEDSQERMFHYQLGTHGAVSSPLISGLRHRTLHSASLVAHSILSGPDEAVVARLLGKEKWPSKGDDKAVGVFMGMVLGDSIGHKNEFLPVRYNENKITDIGERRDGSFQLAPGQWTDDTSMGLCLADSLLMKGGVFDPHDCMHRFIAWWNCGYNNCFRFDSNPHSSHSVGLGGNISMSFASYIKNGEPYTKAGNVRTSGNGSIMRNAAIPVLFHDDIAKAEEVARLQSLTTHQGTEAAECCALLSHICVRGLQGFNLRDVLSSLETTFKTEVPSVAALVASKQEGSDPDRNWNWRIDEQYHFSPTREAEQPGYVGSYAMDAMAMALNVVWRAESFPGVILRCANIRGDSDSFGSVAGQIAGSFYGASLLPEHWLKAVMRWDNNGEIATRASLLFHKQFVV